MWEACCRNALLHLFVIQLYLPPDTGSHSTDRMFFITPIIHTLLQCHEKKYKQILYIYRISSRHFKSLTHWGRVTHICVGKLTNIDSDNGLSPGRRQAIIWTKAGILLIGPLGTNFSEFLIIIHTFSFNKMHLKMSSAKWRPFCLGLNVLNVNSPWRDPMGCPCSLFRWSINLLITSVHECAGRPAFTQHDPLPCILNPREMLDARHWVRVIVPRPPCAIFMGFVCRITACRLSRIWQVSQKHECGDTSQIWMAGNGFSRYLRKALMNLTGK